MTDSMQCTMTIRCIDKRDIAYVWFISDSVVKEF